MLTKTGNTSAYVNGVGVFSDDGSTWTNYTASNGITQSEYGINAIAVSGSSLYAAGGDSISISTNGGLSWSSSVINALGQNGFILSIAVSGRANFAGTTDRLFISTDGGNTWTTYQAPENGYDYVRSLLVVGSTVYAAVGGGLSISQDGGATWVNHPSGNGLGFVDSVAASGSTIYAAGAGLSISSDGGATWRNITGTPPPVQDANARKL